MKSITKVMVVAVALLLAAALFVAPAAARTPTIDDIVDGDTIFVYEEGLNLSGFGAVTSLNKYSDDDPTKALLNQIAVTTPGDFDLLASAVGGEYGVYYPDNTAVDTSSPNVVIREPTVDLDVVPCTFLSDRGRYEALQRERRAVEEELDGLWIQTHGEHKVAALHDGDVIAPRETVLTVAEPASRVRERRRGEPVRVSVPPGAVLRLEDR